MTIFLQYAYIVLTIYFYFMIVYILLSWTPLRDGQFHRLLKKITAPYLDFFRGWLVISNIDFTPMLGLILYQILLMIISRAI